MITSEMRDLYDLLEKNKAKAIDSMRSFIRSRDFYAAVEQEAFATAFEMQASYIEKIGKEDSNAA